MFDTNFGVGIMAWIVKDMIMEHLWMNRMDPIHMVICIICTYVFLDSLHNEFSGHGSSMVLSMWDLFELDMYQNYIWSSLWYNKTAHENTHVLLDIFLYMIHIEQWYQHNMIYPWTYTRKGFQGAKQNLYLLSHFHVWDVFSGIHPKDENQNPLNSTSAIFAREINSVKSGTFSYWNL